MSETTEYLNLVNSLQFTNMNGTQFLYKHNFDFDVISAQNGWAGLS